MNLEPGWLARVFKQCNDDIAEMPEWWRREAGFIREDYYDAAAEEDTLP